jgi:hypothetical protein
MLENMQKTAKLGGPDAGASPPQLNHEVVEPLEKAQHPQQ